MSPTVIPIFLFVGCALTLCLGLLVVGRLFGPRRDTPVKAMPYESGMDPRHDTRRRFDVRFHLVALAFLVFDVELLFLYPWAVASRSKGGVDAAVAAGWISSREMVFWGVAVFFLLLLVGYLYDWRKGVFRWR